MHPTKYSINNGEVKMLEMKAEKKRSKKEKN